VSAQLHNSEHKLVCISMGGCLAYFNQQRQDPHATDAIRQPRTSKGVNVLRKRSAGVESSPFAQQSGSSVGSLLAESPLHNLRAEIYQATLLCTDEGSLRNAIDVLGGERPGKTSSSERIVTFQPGCIGMSWKDGLITDVQEGGQAQQRGVMAGWSISAVGKQKCVSFDDQAFSDASRGDTPYQVTFMKMKARSPSHLKNVSTVLRAVESAKKLEGRMGLDIGGTLAKLVYMQEDDDTTQEFGKTASMKEDGGVDAHSNLSFDLHLGADRYRLSFVSGTTCALQQALPLKDDAASSHPKKVWATGGGAHAFAKAMHEMRHVEMLPVKEFTSLVDGLHFLLEHCPRDEIFILNSANVEEIVNLPSAMYPCLLVNMGSGVSILQINDPEHRNDPDSDLEPYVRIGGTACGGATFLGLAQLVTSGHSFAELVEMASCGNASRVNKLVRDIYGEDGCATLGLPADLTAAHFGKLISGIDAKSNTEAETETTVTFQPGDIGIRCGKYATGLIIEVVEGGQAQRHGVQVGQNIIAVGNEKCDSFKDKVFEDAQNGNTAYQVTLAKEADVVAALMILVVQESALLARCFAQLLQARHNTYPPVFFVGGFLADNAQGRRTIANTFRALAMQPPLFLRHADFLGALGAVDASLRDEELSRQRSCDSIDSKQFFLR